LDGKTVGIIGYGNMGNALQKLRGFEVEVLCYDIEHVGDANAAGLFKRVTTKADVLSLHIPWTPETNQMVDAAFVDALRSLLCLTPLEEIM
jgi:D-3-phosphoglycerate dehydrogenase